MSSAAEELLLLTLLLRKRRKQRCRLLWTHPITSARLTEGAHYLLMQDLQLYLADKLLGIKHHELRTCTPSPCCGLGNTSRWRANLTPARLT